MIFGIQRNHCYCVYFVGMTIHESTAVNIVHVIKQFIYLLAVKYAVDMDRTIIIDLGYRLDQNEFWSVSQHILQLKSK